MSLIRDITNSGFKDALHVTENFVSSGSSTFDSIETATITSSALATLDEIIVRNITVLGTTSGTDGDVFRGVQGEIGPQGPPGNTIINDVNMDNPVFTGLTTIGSGIKITQDDPGHIIYKSYESGSVYGIGQYNGGILRFFTSDNNGPNVSIRFSKFTGGSTDYEGNGTSFDDMMIIKNNGNVGINKANPTEKLDVNGNINCLDIKINNTSIMTTINDLTIGDNPSFDGNQVTIKGATPTLHLRNTVDSSFYIHCNDDKVFFLNGPSNQEAYSMNSTGYWPMVIDLLTNYTKIGGDLDVFGDLQITDVLKANGNRVNIVGSSPTLGLVNSSDRSAFFHNAGGFLYILNGNTNSETWTNNSTGEWPLTINLSSNFATFGGGVSIQGNLECDGIFECATTLKAYGIATFNEDVTCQKSIVASQKVTCYMGSYIGGIESNSNLTDSQHDWVTIGNQVFQPDAGWVNYGLYVQNAIRCLGVSVTSDERIKKDIEDINDIEALTILRALKPRTYKYKDFTKGDQSVIGYIAQEVKEILPQAVSVLDGEIPNIMMNGDLVTLEDGNMELTFENDLPDLVKDDIIRVGQTIRCKVISATQRTVIIEYEEAIKGRAFVAVYGQVIDDFHYLNKDVIFAMTTASCQQIDRELQLEKAKVATLENTILDMMERLSKLENPE